MFDQSSLLQSKALIDQSRKIAILLADDFSLDHLFSGLALFHHLTLLGKEVVLVSDKKLNSYPAFIPNPIPLQHELATYGDLVIRVDSGKAQPGELRYEVKPDGLYIHVKSKNGVFTKTDVAVLGRDFLPDLMIIIGAKDYDQLGRLYLADPAIFTQTNQVVIGIDPATERFGLVNLVSTNQASTSEVVFGLIEAVSSSSIDQVTATYLLAGIIANTSSFTDYLTRPGTMEKAGRLMKLGADKQAIVRDFYKTKSLPALQLWGRLLARVAVTDSNILYSTIQLDDYAKTKSSPELLPEVFRDLVEMASGFEIICAVTETAGGVRVLIASKHRDPSDLLNHLTKQSSVTMALNKAYQYCDNVIAEQTLVGVVDFLRQIPKNPA